MYVDVICPIYTIEDLELFKKCVNSWYESININRLIIGLGGDTLHHTELIRYLEGLRGIKLLAQSQYKTLGYCLQEFFNAVSTEFFVFLHSDVELPSFWFERMSECRIKGIIESLKDPSFGVEALEQARNRRAYSGAQLIYTQAVWNLHWDDDFIYTSEDILLQNIITQRGFCYIKTPIYHKHYRVLGKRSQDKQTILDWQWKSIVKYGRPTKRLALYIRKILKILKRQYDQDINPSEFIEQTNSEWFKYPYFSLS